MNENRRQILEMLSTGKITADEAERLMGALDKEQSSSASAADGPDSGPKPKPKYLRVLIEETKTDVPTKVNIRVPMQLLRAGVRLAALIPDQARVQLNTHLHEKGVAIDLGNLKPENLEELVDQLSDLTVDVDDKDSKVRVFCE